MESRKQTYIISITLLIIGFALLVYSDRVLPLSDLLSQKMKISTNNSFSVGDRMQQLNSLTDSIKFQTKLSLFGIFCTSAGSMLIFNRVFRRASREIK